MIFKVPKSFCLHGQKIEVKFDPLLICKDDNEGEAHYRINEIILMPSTEGTPRLPSQIEESFCHELVHFLFHFAQYPHLRADEDLVNRVAGLLHQALTTMEN